MHISVLIARSKGMQICFCRDWNGSKRGHVYKFLRSQGFVSSYDTAHQYTDDDAHKVIITLSYHTYRIFLSYANERVIDVFLLMFFSFTQWVSHRNHRGNICGVDFIWLLNPNRYRKLLKTSWNETVFSMFKVRNLLPPRLYIS